MLVFSQFVTDVPVARKDNAQLLATEGVFKFGTAAAAAGVASSNPESL